MVVGTREPDIIKDIIAHFKADAELEAYVAGRVAVVFPEGRVVWPMPTYAILVRRAGGLAPRMSTGEHRARIDVRYYGSGATPGIRRRTADELWQIGNAVLAPPPPFPAGWKSDRLIVSSADPESEPIQTIEPGTDWPLVIASYTVKYVRLWVAA